MKNDQHVTSRMLICAGALMTVSSFLFAICTKLAYGGILWAAAFCMFLAAYNFRMIENKKEPEDQKNEKETV